jgi:hypothetical protein
MWLDYLQRRTDYCGVCILTSPDLDSIASDGPYSCVRDPIAHHRARTNECTHSVANQCAANAAAYELAECSAAHSHS